MKQTKERLLHHVTISVFSKHHEQEEDVLRGLDALSPIPAAVLFRQDAEQDPERPRMTHYRMRGVPGTPARGSSGSSVPDVTLTVQQAATDDGQMTIYTLFFRKLSATSHFMRQVLGAMTPAEKEEFREEPGKLLDHEMKLSARLDKELLKKGKLSLTDDSDCYQVKASIAAYPKTEERIIETLERILAERL